MTEVQPTITVDGKEYPIAGFNETIQRLVAVHTEWRADLQKERLAIAKTEAAIRAIEAELAQNVREALTPAPTSDVAANDTSPAK